MTSDIHEDDRQESGRYDPQDNPGTVGSNKISSFPNFRGTKETKFYYL
ncbi:hypothetical protein ACE1CI_26820 [Aerosakkonemataceae cyanobacterium BLCC-F50]|uniref:Uncharacterized protein n=1 Tax=Floridaenema flaviceps BLCC-F50 TaxID=3153642 RepID=A0ABV4XXY1_9CYAN